jgi:PAS domain S-box-containing protein
LSQDFEAGRLRDEVAAKLAAIVESSDDAIVSKTLDSVIRTWNAGAERIFGWSADEAIGKPITIIIPPDRHDEEQRIMARLREGHRVDHFETVRLAKDGRLIDVSVTVSPVRNAAGEIVGASKIARDVTLQKQLLRSLEAARQAAESANGAKDVFLSVLSHELRTPLTPVLASLSFLESRDDLPEELRRELAMIRINVETEARLVDDLLDLTRITRGNLLLRRETMDAHVALRNTVSMLSSEIREKALTVQLALEAREHYVLADPGRLQQILLSLLGNAVKFTPEGGRVTVRTLNIEQRLAIEVIDTGPGIPHEMMADLFEPFGTAAQLGGRVGMGLAITRSLVQMHGGTIAAGRGASGQGAVLRVELPTTTLEPAAAPREDAPLRGEILLVEDHADTRKVMARLLASFGFTVTIAGTVAEALNVSKQKDFDLLISDIGLPDGTGNDIMRELRHRMKLKGIALSGFGQDEDVRRSEEAGFEAHLIKPINFQTLRKMLTDLLPLG